MSKKTYYIIFILIVSTVIISLKFFTNSNRRKKAEVDQIYLSKICDTIKEITEQPTITFDGFKPEELDRINFYLIRNNKIIESIDSFTPEYSNERGSHKTFKIPFKRFLKTDSIIVKTSTLFFKVPQFHHYAYLHYGNFGYLGTSDCRIEKNKKISQLNQLKNYELPQ